LQVPEYVMSLNFKSLGRTGIKALVGSYIREHRSEIVIFAITTTMLVGVAALATGDITQALARGHKH
jgi:hypothetical protein